MMKCYRSTKQGHQDVDHSQGERYPVRKGQSHPRDTNRPPGQTDSLQLQPCEEPFNGGKTEKLQAQGKQNIKPDIIVPYLKYRMQLEVERLRSCVDILKRNLKATREELEQKKHLITKMMERGLTSHSPSPSVEVEPGKTSSEGESTEGCVDDLDIDSLLQANLGAVNITDFLNLSGSDNVLPDFSVLEAELSSEKVRGQ